MACRWGKRSLKKSIIGMIEHLRGLIEINNMIKGLYKE